jgi:HSP20 family protein
MASTPVEVKKPVPAPAPVPDVWRSLRSEMDRLFDRFSSTFGVPSLRRMFDVEPAWRFESSLGFAAPAIDVSEDEKAYKITAELPGLEARDLDVSISGDTLVIKGEKQQEKEQKDKNYHVTERTYGSFQRAFALPEGVARDKIAADLSKGVLTVTLPKTAEAQKPTQKIEVKAAA